MNLEPIRYAPMRKEQLSCHPLVRELYRLMKIKRMTQREVCRRAGCNDRMLHYWKTVYSPRVANLEAALNVLGYTLKIVPMETKHDA